MNDRHVCVKGDDTTAVRNEHRVAVPAFPSREDHLSDLRCPYRVPHARADIDTGVLTNRAEDRMDAGPEARPDRTRCRHDEPLRRFRPGREAGGVGDLFVDQAGERLTGCSPSSDLRLPTGDTVLQFGLYVELYGSTLLELGQGSLERNAQLVSFEAGILAEPDVLVHHGLGGAKLIEQIPIATRSEVEERPPYCRTVRVVGSEPGTDRVVGTDECIDRSNLDLIDRGCHCSFGVDGELLAIEHFSFCGRESLTCAVDACGLRVDECLDRIQRLLDHGVIGPKEIDLLECLLFSFPRSLPLATQVGDVLAKGR